YAATEADLLPENPAGLRPGFGSLVKRFGAPGSLVLLYVEESGIPLPVPGDVYVLYLGNLAKGSAGWLVAAWLGIIAVVVAGSSTWEHGSAPPPRASSAGIPGSMSRSGPSLSGWSSSSWPG